MDDIERIIQDADYRGDLRHRFITDHFFAAEMMGFPMHPVLHEPVRQLHIQKNPALPIEQQAVKKKRMHLDPRFSYKTTFNRVDKVQWIAAFPQVITVLNQSSTQKLAKAISETQANYFYCPKYKQQTRLQACFPELVCDKLPFSNGAEEWDSNSHDINAMDSTIAFTSPASAQSGWHPWVLNCDDMVDTKNSGLKASTDVRQGVIDTFDTNKNTLVPGGYLYLIGTRYHPFDLYGVRLQDMDPDEWEVLIRHTLTRKDGSKFLPGEFPDEDDLIFEFDGIPGISRSDYARLRGMFYEGYESFMCQQQNDPQGGHVATFDEKLYASCEADPDHLPAYRGELYICWRLPYGGKSTTNVYLEGVAARIFNGKVYVIDCWRYAGTPSHQAEMIAKHHRMLQPDGMMILDTPGCEGYQPHIRNEAARKNISLRVQWRYWEENESLRVSNLKQMEPLMKVGRLLFAQVMTKGADCRKQFVHFGLIEETGLIECVSQLAGQVPVAMMRANMEEEELYWQQQRRDDAMLSSFMNQQGMVQVDEQAEQKVKAHMQAMQKTTTWAMPPLPGGLDG